VLGTPIVPTNEPVCFGYYLVIEDPLKPEGSGNYVTVYIADPVVLNLKGGPIKTQGVAESDAYFDMQNTGHAVKTGWITKDEGFLFYDKDSTGSMKSDRDLVPGLAALREIDSNHDGHLNSADVEWGKIKVWTDEGLDGDFHESELFTLVQLGITDIDLHYQSINKDSHGNTILNVSNFTWSDGTRGAIGSIELVSIPPAQQPEFA
jgi:hypothetical protein